MIELKVDKYTCNQRLDKFVKRYLKKAPSALLYKLMRKNNIKLNSKTAKGNEMLKDGDLVSLYLSNEMLKNLTEDKKIAKAEQSFGIVFEDENILICNKPIGLLSQKEKKSDNSLIDQVLYYLNPTSSFVPGLCNRLDRNTSGLVLVGKNLPASQELNRVVKERLVQKYYTTLVVGKLSGKGILRGFHVKNEKTNEVKILDKPSPGCKEVLTGYRELNKSSFGAFSSKGYSLLEIQLFTGRSHQIRAHLQLIDHPIVGDRKYGDPKVNQLFQERFSLNDQFLHAGKLEFGLLEGNLAYLNHKAFYAEMPALYKNVLKNLHTVSG